MDSYRAISQFIRPVPPQVTAAWRYEDVAIRQTDLITTHIKCVLTEQYHGLLVTQETLDRMDVTVCQIMADYPDRHFNYRAVTDSFGNLRI